MHSAGKHAVVIGSSIAGLLAGRILSGHFEKVTILDRDVLPEEDVDRKGVPQGRHSHVMVKAGERIISKWFPGFYEGLNDSGEVTFIDSSDFAFYHYGVWRLRIPTGTSKTLMTRPYLERRVRHRLKEFPNITIQQQVEVTGLLTNPSGTAVTGVRIRHKDNGGDEQELFADLVLDTGGRGSQVPNWLEAMKHPKPEEQTVKIDIGYSSRLFEVPEDKEPDWQFLTVYPKPPHGTKIGFIQRVEKNRWIVTLGGCIGDHPPSDEAGFMEFAKQLETPNAYEFIKNAVPVTPIKSHRFPASQRRYYEKLSRFPTGLLVAGDAICSFNPIYGHGMSISILGLDKLDQCLKECAGNLEGLHQRFFPRAAEFIDDAWLLATTEDFRYPNVKGKKPFGYKLTNWYTGQMFELASVDPKSFFQVAMVWNLEAKPKSFLAPYFMKQVLKRNLPWSTKKKQTVYVGYNRKA